MTIRQERERRRRRNLTSDVSRATVAADGRTGTKREGKKALHYPGPSLSAAVGMCPLRLVRLIAKPLY